MNPDFLSDLLKGQGGANALTAFLPMLLGGKKPDLSSLIGSLTGATNQKDDSAYPPLFGDSKADSLSSPSGILGLFRNLIPSADRQKSDAPKEDPVRSEYPYELQYNRPDMLNMHKNG